MIDIDHFYQRIKVHLKIFDKSYENFQNVGVPLLRTLTWCVICHLWLTGGVTFRLPETLMRCCLR